MSCVLVEILLKIETKMTEREGKKEEDKEGEWGDMRGGEERRGERRASMKRKICKEFQIGLCL